MEQNSLKIFKIFGILFIITFVISSVLFFIPKAGKLKSVSYGEALKLSSKNGKAIFITTFSGWDKKQKLNSQILFSNDDLVNFIDSNFNSVIINTDNDENKKIIEDYSLNSNRSIITDKTGKPITYLPNALGSSEFLAYSEQALKLPFYDWYDIKDAQNITDSTGKFTFCFIASNINQGLMMADVINHAENKNYLEMNFNPVYLYLKYKPDFENAKQILGFDDPAIKTMVAEFSISSSSAPQFSVNSTIEPKLVIIGKDKVIISQITIEESFWKDKNLQKLIDNSMKNENLNKVK